MLAAVLLPVVTGCATAADEGPETTEGEVVVGLPSLANQVAVQPDRLEFDPGALGALERHGVLAKIDTYASAADKSAAEPVYLVGERQADALGEDGAIKPDARNPAGYLRRAVSWEKRADGVVVVKTEPATLSEAIEEIKKNGFLGEDDPAGVSIQGNTDGENTASGFGNADRHWQTTLGPEAGFAPIDLSGRELWSKSFLSGGNAKLALKTARINIKPTVDVHLVTKRFIPKNAEATITTDLGAQLEFEASTSAAFDVSQSNTLLKKSIGTHLKKLPLTVGLEVKYACEVAASGPSVASTGVTANGRVRAGAAVEGRHIKGILDTPTYNLGFVRPKLDAKVQVAGACHLVTELTMQVFDAAGPTATADVYAILDANGTATNTGAVAAAKVKVGVEASVGGGLRPFGIKLANINVPPYKLEKEIFNGQIGLGR
jgi:hypothetical protein